MIFVYHFCKQPLYVKEIPRVILLILMGPSSVSLVSMSLNLGEYVCAFSKCKFFLDEFKFLEMDLNFYQMLLTVFLVIIFFSFDLFLWWISLMGFKIEILFNSWNEPICIIYCGFSLLTSYLGFFFNMNMFKVKLVCVCF